MIEIHMRNARVLNDTCFQKTMKNEDSVFNTLLIMCLMEQQLYSGRIGFIQ